MRVVVAISLCVLGVGGACSAPTSSMEPPSTKTAATTTSSSSSSPTATPQRTPQPAGIPPRFDLPTGVAVVQTPAGERRFVVELAVKDHERQRGLMYRSALGEDEGMVFFFEAMAPLSFWMKNTWIPLDMLFIDDDLTVVGIVESAEPMTTTPRSPGKEARFVLEIQGGLSQQLGLKPLQKVRFEGVPEALWRKQAAAP